MFSIKIELTGDTKEGKRNIGTYTFDCEVNATELRIVKSVGEVLMKDHVPGRYFLESLIIQTKGQDLDE
jgi:hypothetical protein